MSAQRDAKRAVRDTVRTRLAAAPPGDRARWSAAICEALEASEVWTNARSVLVYLGDPGEPDLDGAIARAIARGVRVSAPRMDWDAGAMDAVELRSLEATQTRRHGIREPAGGAVVVPRR